MVLDWKNIWNDVRQLESDDTSPWLQDLQQKTINRIIGIHHMSYITGQSEKDTYIKNHVSHIKDKMPHISDMFCNSLWITALNSVSLFESPWVLTKVSNKFHTTLYQDFRNSFIWWDDLSPVAQAYEHVFMEQICIKKAMMHALIHMIPQWTPLHTSMVQQYLQEFTEAFQYRWGYQNPDTKETFGVSGTSMSECVVAEILKQAGFTWGLDDIAKHFKCWRVDLLAGIWDELMARLMAHDESEWGAQIQIVGDDIKQHMKNNTLWLLC